MQQGLKEDGGRWKVGILGAGYISGAHMMALRATPGVRVTAVCDASISRAKAFARQWKIESAVANVHEMIEGPDRPDAVHIITPPTAHFETAAACIRAGCNAFIEKPLTPTSSEAALLEKYAEEAGVQAAVNHNQSWHPAVLRLKELAGTRVFGRIDHLSVCLSTGLRQLSAGQHSHWMFREPGNILLEQAPHPLSQIVRLMGPIRDVSSLASGKRILNTGCPFWDTWQINLLCERGTAQLLLAFGRDDIDNWIHLVGQDASAHADLRRNTITLHRKRRWAPALADLLDSSRNAAALAGQGLRGFTGYTRGFLKLGPPQDTFSAGMHNSISAFYDALSGGRAVPVPIAEGRMIVETCERIFASARGRMNPAGESDHE